MTTKYPSICGDCKHLKLKDGWTCLKDIELTDITTFCALYGGIPHCPDHPKCHLWPETGCADCNHEAYKKGGIL